MHSSIIEKSRLSPAPHMRAGFSTNTMMLITLATLLLPAGAGIFNYGLRAMAILGVCLASGVVADNLCARLRGKPWRLEISSLVSSLLLALILPPALPIWMAGLGVFFAVAIVKEAFGGLGQNIFNPALGARAFLLASFALPMSQWIEPSGFSADAVTSATPLVSGFVSNLPLNELLWGLFTGSVPGFIGSGALFVIIGGLILLLTGVIDYKAPLVYLGAVAVTSLLFGENPLFHLLAGGVVFAAFYFITDPVTTPVYWPGKVVFAIGAGVLTMLIRQLGNAPDGVAYAVLIMNAVTPLIDRYIKPRPMGLKRANRNAV